MAKGGKGYLGLDNWIVNLILAIIPFTSWLLGGITRILRGHIIAGIVQLLIPIMTLIFWITDIIGMVTKKDLMLWAN